MYTKRKVRNFTLKQLNKPLQKYAVLVTIILRIFPLICVTMKQSETVEIFSVVKMCFKRTSQNEESLTRVQTGPPQIRLDRFIGGRHGWIVFVILSFAISKDVCSNHQKVPHIIIWSIFRFLYCTVIIPEVNTQPTYFFPMAYTGR